MGSILVRVSISVIQYHEQKQLGGEEGLFQLTTLGTHSITEKSQGRNSELEPGCRTEAERGGPLPTGLLLGVCSGYVLYTPASLAAHQAYLRAIEGHCFHSGSSSQTACAKLTKEQSSGHSMLNRGSRSLPEGSFPKGSSS